MTDEEKAKLIAKAAKSSAMADLANGFVQHAGLELAMKGRIDMYGICEMCQRAMKYTLGSITDGMKVFLQIPDDEELKRLGELAKKCEEKIGDADKTEMASFILGDYLHAYLD